MHLLTYLRLRLTLLGRLAREIGAWRLAVVVPLLTLALLQAVSVLGRHPLGRWVLPLLLAGTLLGAHRQRGDAQFLPIFLLKATRWLAVEYALLSLPLALGLLALRSYGAALLTPLLAALVAWAPPAREVQANRHRWRSLFRAEAFEWVGGMRPLGWLLWLGLLVVLGHYGTPEPPTMLALAMRQPGQFLRRRLGLGLGYGAITAAPLLACLGNWGLAVGLGLYWLGLLALCLLAKYAFYPNATHLRTTQGLVLALGLLGVGQAIFPPVMLVTVVGLLWQSQRRLGQLLPVGTAGQL